MKMRTKLSGLLVAALIGLTTAGGGQALELCAKADRRGDPSQPKDGSPIRTRSECKAGKEVSVGTTEDLAVISNKADQSAVEANSEAIGENSVAISTKADVTTSNRFEVVGAGPGLSATASCPEGSAMTGAACTSGSAVTGMSSVSDESVSCVDEIGSTTAIASAFCILPDPDQCSGEGGGHNCDVNATCTDTDSGFTCACNTGYYGDGVSCELGPTVVGDGACTNSIDALSVLGTNWEISFYHVLACIGASGNEFSWTTCIAELMGTSFGCAECFIGRSNQGYMSATCGAATPDLDNPCGGGQAENLDTDVCRQCVNGQTQYNVSFEDCSGLAAQQFDIPVATKRGEY